MYKNQENAKLNSDEISTTFNFDELEDKLQQELDSEFAELDFLEKESEKIGNPDALGETIKTVIWEQFLNQMGVKSGEDFIKDNKGLTLDLRDDAHIQTTDNFAKGKIAKHNTHIDYQERHDSWQSNFQKDENGNVKTKIDNRTNQPKEVLQKSARDQYDKNRPTGSGSIQMDHTVSAGEIIRDPSANAHLTQEERIKFANGDKNLNPLDSAANQSKGDSSMNDWLNSEKNGEKPADRFNINEKELREKDEIARQELDKIKKQGEKKSIETGKQSQKEEALRIGGSALKSMAMLLLSELIKEIISKLVAWFKLARRNLESLATSIKNAIKSFVNKLKSHILNAGNNAITTIATAIFGPVISIIKKIGIMFKQGWKSIKDAIAYIRDPKNKGKDFGLMVLEIGKIVTAGLSAIGALVLGEVIEKSLIIIPGFAFEIPLFGSLANVIGLFMGAVISGIIGAIIINFLDKITAKRRKTKLLENKIDTQNVILVKQEKLLDAKIQSYIHSKNEVVGNILDRHQTLSDKMMTSTQKMEEKIEERKKIKLSQASRVYISNHEKEFDEMNDRLKKLLED